jgi:hypothetical protein
MGGDYDSMKRFLIALGCILAGSFFVMPSVAAASLKLAPLEYRTTLKQGEKKKGFIDVSNPTKETVRVTTSTQAFRQTDDNGSLQFFDSEQLSAGVKLDLDEFELGPREAVRMYFILDSSRLPSGDVYGAIFFTTAPSTPKTGVGQSVRLGTLLSIVNGTPGQRDAEVTELSLPWLQLSDTVDGRYRIKNIADPKKATGFYPTVQIQAAPFGEAKKQVSKLTFAGITRTNDFTLKTLPLGIYKVSVGYSNSVKTRWVIVASPPALILLAVVSIVATIGLRIIRTSRKKRRFEFGKYR